MPNRAFIGLGSNLGDRAANYREAIQRIASIPETRVVRQSSIYETEPVGDLKGAFLNGVIEVETEINAEVLMRRLLAIDEPSIMSGMTDSVTCRSPQKLTSITSRSESAGSLTFPRSGWWV